MLLSNDGGIMRRYAFKNEEGCQVVVLARVVKGRIKVVQNSIKDIVSMSGN